MKQNEIEKYTVKVSNNETEANFDFNKIEIAKAAASLFVLDGKYHTVMLVDNETNKGIHFDPMTDLTQEQRDKIKELNNNNMKTNETMTVNANAESTSFSLRLFERHFDGGESPEIREIIPYSFPIYSLGNDWEFVLLSAAADAYKEVPVECQSAIDGYVGIVSETTVKFNDADGCFDSEIKVARTLYVSREQVENFIKEAEEVENETMTINTDKE